MPCSLSLLCGDRKIPTYFGEDREYWVAIKLPRGQSADDFSLSGTTALWHAKNTAPLEIAWPWCLKAGAHRLSGITDAIAAAKGAREDARVSAALAAGPAFQLSCGKYQGWSLRDLYDAGPSERSYLAWAAQKFGSDADGVAVRAFLARKNVPCAPTESAPDPHSVVSTRSLEWSLVLVEALLSEKEMRPVLLRLGFNLSRLRSLSESLQKSVVARCAGCLPDQYERRNILLREGVRVLQAEHDRRKVEETDHA